MGKTKIRIEQKKNFANLDETHKQIRGSSLLFAGKLVSVGINLIAQVMIVRYLSKTDFGAWGYVLALVAFFQAFSTLGLSRSITRFIPIYHEKDEYEKLFGTIVLVMVTIFAASVIVVTAVFLYPELIAGLVSGNYQPVTLLFIMIFLVPVQAIDVVLLGLFASFTSPKAIFIRKYILEPVLKLSVVLLLVSLGSTVFFLAYGYLAVSIFGVVIYIWIFIRMLRQHGVLKRFKFNTLNIPAKEIFAFTIPLLSSDILAILMLSTDTLILGYFHNTEAVASYQVILPAVRINKMVMTSFAFLFTPLAARFFAKNDYAGINDLYLRIAIWLAVLSFPMFALSFSLAAPLTVTLYGERYADSWVFLNMLAFARYFSASLGFNGLTLTVIGKVKFIMLTDLATALANVVGNLILIPPYGALGAAIATSVSIVIHNILKQLGLKYLGGLHIFDKKYISVYLLLYGSALGLFFLQQYTSLHFYILLPITGLAYLSILRICQKKLDVERTFPELLKIPYMHKILGVKVKQI